jgi:hypothetical protein
MRKLVDEVFTLTRFLSAMLHRPEHAMRVGEFVIDANMAFDEMQTRSDTRFSARWETGLPYSTEILGGGRFSGLELLEGAARIEQYLLIAGCGPAEKIKNWENRSIFGVYAPVYSSLLSRFPPDIARAIIDVAFMTPIDPAFAGATDGVLIVEEVLPSFRLVRLLEAAKDISWPDDPAELYDLLANKLCARAGLCLPKDIVRVGLEGQDYSGKDSWGFDHRVNGLPAETDPGPIYEYAQVMVRRAMRIREQFPGSFIWENCEHAYPFRPLLMFYRDWVEFGFDFCEDFDQRFMLGVNAYWSLISGGIACALISDGSVEKLLRLQSAIEARAFCIEFPNDWFGKFIREDSLEIGAERVRQSLSVKLKAEGLLGNTHLSLLTPDLRLEP